jgi:hypothetical protein
MFARGPAGALTATVAINVGGLDAPAQASAPQPSAMRWTSTGRQAPATAPKPGSAKDFDSHWWGLSWTLSNNGTKTLVHYLKLGSGVATIVALPCGGSVAGVPCGVAYGLAAILIVVGGDYLDRCNKGSGAVIKKPWVGVPFCSSR